MKSITYLVVGGLCLTASLAQAQQTYYAPNQPVYQQPVVPVAPVPAYDWARDVEQSRRHLQQARLDLARLPPDYHRDQILSLIQQAEAMLPATPAQYHYH